MVVRRGVEGAELTAAAEAMVEAGAGEQTSLSCTVTVVDGGVTSRPGTGRPLFNLSLSCSWALRMAVCFAITYATPRQNVEVVKIVANSW